jgi:enolase-phosphatase E1
VIEFSGRAILLDIEGTAAPISYVYDVMFPFVRQRLDAWLAAHWDRVELNNTIEQIARDAGFGSRAAWVHKLNDDQQRVFVRDHVFHLMDQDAKTTGLKALQGMIWDEGYATRALRSEVFRDLPPALKQWRDAGRKVYIYSSGSIHAQKLFFGHTQRGDLLPWIDGHYDTTIGGKREPASYEAIARDCNLAPRELLFLSDIVAELDAAAGTGMHTGLCRRPGNPAPAPHRHREITSFDEVKLV